MYSVEDDHSESDVVKLDMGYSDLLRAWDGAAICVVWLTNEKSRRSFFSGADGRVAARFSIGQPMPWFPGS